MPQPSYVTHASASPASRQKFTRIVNPLASKQFKVPPPIATGALKQTPSRLISKVISRNYTHLTPPSSSLPLTRLNSPLRSLQIANSLSVLPLPNASMPMSTFKSRPIQLNTPLKPPPLTPGSHIKNRLSKIKMVESAPTLPFKIF